MDGTNENEGHVFDSISYVSYLVSYGDPEK